MNPGDIPAEGELERAAELLKALAHPLRLEILEILARSGTCICACDFEEHLSTNQPTVAHHLRILRSAGAIHARKTGTWIYYRIDEGMVPLLSAAHRMSAGGKNGRIEARVARPAPAAKKKRIVR